MGVGKNLEINKQKQQQHTMTQQEQMREHLTSLQNWDLAENQTLEQRRAEHTNLMITQQKEMNARLQKKAGGFFGFLKVKKTAEGEPAQIQKPAKKTYKQKKEDKRLDQKVKEKNPMADHMSYHMVEDLKEEQRLRDNSFAALSQELKEQAEHEKVDKRVLRIFVHGYQVNQDGEPASEKDAKYKAADQKFLEDYISNDVERRRPHLDRMMEQALTVKMTPEMITPEYMEHHAGQVHKDLNTLVYFANVYSDPVNKPYFDALPQLTRDLIESRVMTRYAQFGATMVHTCATKGVDADGCSFSQEVRDEGSRNMYRELVAQEQPLMRAAQEEAETMEREAIQREMERRKAAEKVNLMRGATRMKDIAETMPDIAGLNLTTFVTGYSFDELAKYRAMIEAHPAEYQKNQQLIDELYQGMYRAIDALGDTNLEAMAAGSVGDIITQKKEELTETNRLLIQASTDQLEEIGKTAELITNRISAHAGALKTLLTGSKMTESAKDLLRGMGHQV